MAQNIRRSISDSYDPKQRIVGGIVLFLLMLLLYLILKIILGISSSVHDSNYILREKIFDEPLLDNTEVYEETSEPGEQVASSVPPASVSNVTETVNVTSSPSNKLNRPLPGGFVFLDLRGNPMQKEVYQTPVASTPQKTDTDKTPIEGVHWVVQAGSFLAEDRAQRMVQELKEAGVETEIVKISKWFTVRLLPQRNRQEAEQQLRQLRQVKNIKGLIKKIE